MTESVAPINPTTDTWLDLIDRLNEIIDLLENNIPSTGGTLTGDISINGTVAANALTSNGAVLVPETRTIGTINGITGGGPLSSNLTLSLTTPVLDAVAAAESAVQPSDLNGNIEIVLQKMTTSERNLISSPTPGRVIYNTTLNVPQCFNGTTWVNMVA